MRGNFGMPRMAQVRPPLATAMEKTLTANPMQAAQQQLKASRMPPPQGYKPKLPPAPRKPNQFFGE